MSYSDDFASQTERLSNARLHPPFAISPFYFVENQLFFVRRFQTLR